MLTQKQMRIFEVFARNPFGEFTRTQIKREAKENSNNAIARTINRLLEEGIVKEKKVGRSGLLNLDMDKNATINYIAQCNTMRLDHIASMSVTRMMSAVDAHTPFYSLVVFGSYSIGLQQKDSDLDIAVFIDDLTDRRAIEVAINTASVLSLLELDAHVIPRSEMHEMLTNDEENLGKQIARKHMAISNQRLFYGLIQEGIRRGFRT
jgi:predicted nucleotidyltransferase